MATTSTLYSRPGCTNCAGGLGDRGPPHDHFVRGHRRSILRRQDLGSSREIMSQCDAAAQRLPFESASGVLVVALWPELLELLHRKLGERRLARLREQFGEAELAQRTMSLNVEEPFAVRRAKSNRPPRIMAEKDLHARVASVAFVSTISLDSSNGTGGALHRPGPDTESAAAVVPTTRTKIIGAAIINSRLIASSHPEAHTSQGRGSSR